MNNILATAYSFSWLAFAFSTVLWFFFKRVLLGTKIPGKLLLFSLLAYGLSFFMVHLAVDGINSLGLLFRDALLWAGIALAAKLLAGNKSALLLMMVGIGAGAWFKYFDYLRVSAGYVQTTGVVAQQTTTTQATATETPALLADPDAEILFDLKRPEDLPALAKLLAPYRVRIQKAFPEVADVANTELDDYYTVDIPAEFEDQRDAILALIAQSDKTDDQEINESLSLDPLELQTATAAESTPSPTPSNFFANLLNDPYADSLGQFQILNFKDFYTALQQVSPVKKARIAILDTGVDANHEDLKGTYVSIAPKHDKDVAGHGTHCAGIAAAVANNGIGIASCAGVRDWVEVTSVKVLSDFGSGTEQTIVAGILTAADKGADVISMSLGGPRNAASHRAYDQAIQYANRKGAIVVVAAGNENRAANTRLPAASPYAITVSAVDNNGQKASFSNWFSNHQQEFGVAAPGVAIFSTIPGNRYARFNGTSMATPCVAGLVAVLKAIKPSLNTAEVYQMLYETGAETGNTGKTGRLVQPAALLKAKGLL